MKSGDLVLYDRFGSRWTNLSPSVDMNDFALGVVLQIIETPPGGIDNSYAEVMKDDGSKACFSLVYLTNIVT